MDSLVRKFRGATLDRADMAVYAPSGRFMGNPVFQLDLRLIPDPEARSPDNADNRRMKRGFNN